MWQKDGTGFLSVSSFVDDDEVCLSQDLQGFSLKFGRCIAMNDVCVEYIMPCVFLIRMLLSQLFQNSQLEFLEQAAYLKDKRNQVF